MAFGIAVILYGTQGLQEGNGPIDLRAAMAVKLDSLACTASELLIHMHITYMVWALLAASEATSSSKQPEVKYDLRFEISDP